MAQKKLTTEQLMAVLADALRDETLRKLVLSRPTEGTKGKLTARAYQNHGQTWVQTERFAPDGKVFHQNLPPEELAQLVADALPGFRQLNLYTEQRERQARLSRDGLWVLGEKRAYVPAVVSEGVTAGVQTGHDRAKRYCFPDGEYSPFLHKLGLTDAAGRVYKRAYDKFRQINHFLSIVETVLPALPAEGELVIAELCCGRSVLGFALYAYLTERLGRSVRLVGVDQKADVIADMRATARELGFDGADFIAGDIAQYTAPAPVDLTLSLHACDTATDWVLYRAVGWQSRVILSSPCCHHELAAQLRADSFAPVSRYPILRERYAETLTDALRCELLREAGYRTDILEFVPTEHTPKNLLIRALRGSAPRGEYAQLRARCEALGVSPLLLRLLTTG